MALFDEVSPTLQYFSKPIFGDGSWLRKRNGEQTVFGKVFENVVPALGAIGGSAIGMPNIGTDIVRGMNEIDLRKNFENSTFVPQIENDIQQGYAQGSQIANLVGNITSSVTSALSAGTTGTPDFTSFLNFRGNKPVNTDSNKDVNINNSNTLNESSFHLLMNSLPTFQPMMFANGGKLDRSLSDYIVNNRERGGFTESVFNDYVLPVEENKAVVVKNSINPSDAGNVTGNSVIGNLMTMIARPETGGIVNPYSTVNRAGFAGKWQVGSQLMQQFGIDRNRFINDPTYQTQQTERAMDWVYKEALKRQSQAPDVPIEQLAGTAWLKGVGGLDRVIRNNSWNTDRVGGLTSNQYYQRMIGQNFADGGKPKPKIYVNSPNDPRYKGYKDSLNLYNSYKNTLSELQKQGYTPYGSTKNRKFIPTNSERSQEYMQSFQSKGNQYSRKLNDKEYEVLDFKNDMVNTSLPYQLFNKDIKPLGISEYGGGVKYKVGKDLPEHIQVESKGKFFLNSLIGGASDVRPVFYYDNVNPKEEVIVNTPDTKNAANTKANIKQKGVLKAPIKPNPIVKNSIGTPNPIEAIDKNNIIVNGKQLPIIDFKSPVSNDNGIYERVIGSEYVPQSGGGYIQYKRNDKYNYYNKKLQQMNKGNYQFGGKPQSQHSIIYDKGDKTEDILMFDKKSGEVVGQMRYDERIFDQKANKVMERLLAKGDTVKLGEFVAKEMRTHSDLNGNMFQDGGKFKEGQIYSKSGKTYIYNKRLNRLINVDDISKTGVDKSEYFVNADSVSADDYTTVTTNNITPKQKDSIFNLTGVDLRNNDVVTGFSRLSDLYNQGKERLNSYIDNLVSGSVSATTTGPSDRPINNTVPKQLRARITEGIRILNNNRGLSSGAGENNLPVSDDVKLVQEFLNDKIKERYTTVRRDSKGNPIGAANRGADGQIYDPTGRSINELLLKNDGKLDNTTLGAIQAWNLQHPDAQIRLGKDNKGRDTITELPKGNLSSLPAVSAISPYEVDYNRLNNLPDINSPVTQTGATDVGNGNNFFSGENLRRLGGNLANVAQGIYAAREASKPLPTYQLPQDYVDYGNQLRQQSQLGFTPQQQAVFNQQLNTSRLAGYNQVAAASGGGGSQGAVLGALNNVNQSQLAALNNYAINNANLQQTRQDRYGNFVMRNQQQDFNNFANTFNQAAQYRNMASQTLASNIQDIENRNNYYNMYQDPNSVYSRLINSQAQREQEELTALQRINRAGLPLYRSLSINQQLSEADLQRIKNTIPYTTDGLTIR